MDAAELKQQWQQWIQRNIGGPEGRHEVALQAAMNALGQGKSRDEAAAAARQAASTWEAQKVVVPATPTPPGLTRGHVTGLQQRQEVYGRMHTQWQGQTPYSLVWDFRLARSPSPDGQPQPPIGVEFRSPSGGYWGSTTKGIVGSILNGDEVFVDTRDCKPGELLRVKEVWNLTTNSCVRVRGSSQSRVFAPLTVKAEKYGIMRGRITALQQRQERPGMIYSRTIWSFRLQRTGPDGGLLPLVEVEMLSREFEGSLAAGDEVELDASRSKAGDVVAVKQVRNLSSNSVVRQR